MGIERFRVLVFFAFVGVLSGVRSVMFRAVGRIG